MARETRPLELLSVGDGIFLTVGMIIGALIFKAPSTVAGATSGPLPFLFAWLLGGAISLCGALVYAELASRHPHTGGEYVFLSEGMGRGVESNFDARFTCDALNIAMIKDAMVARRCGGKMFDLVCRYR